MPRKSYSWNIALRVSWIHETRNKCAPINMLYWQWSTCCSTSNTRVSSFCTQRNSRSGDPVFDQRSLSKGVGWSQWDEFKLSALSGGCYRLSLNTVRTELDSWQCASWASWLTHNSRLHTCDPQTKRETCENIWNQQSACHVAHLLSFGLFPIFRGRYTQVLS